MREKGRARTTKQRQWRIGEAGGARAGRGSLSLFRRLNGFGLGTTQRGTNDGEHRIMNMGYPGHDSSPRAPGGRTDGHLCQRAQAHTRSRWRARGLVPERACRSDTVAEKEPAAGRYAHTCSFCSSSSSIADVMLLEDEDSMDFCSWRHSPGGEKNAQLGLPLVLTRTDHNISCVRRRRCWQAQP
jgi:hypothetical protein